jgi:Tol biopolymer transport system component
LEKLCLSDSGYDIIDEEPKKPKHDAKRKSLPFLRRKVHLSLPLSVLVMIGVVISGVLVFALSGQRETEVTSPALDLETTPDPDSVPPCGASPAAPNGRIVFSSGMSGEGQDLYIINPDGTNLCRLTDKIGHEYNPSWTAQGIIYNSSDIDWSGLRDVYAIQPDGSNPRFLMTSDQNVFAAPSGALLAYTKEGDVFIQEIGNEAIRLTSTDTIYEMFPIWSPDSRYLAYADSSTISIIDIDCVRNTQNPVRCGVENFPLPVEDEVEMIFLSDWSPDGSSLTLSYRPSFGVDVPIIINTDGTNVRFLNVPGGWVDAARWSPNSQQLVFSGWLEEELGSSLFIRDLQTGELRRITPALNATQYDWSN